MKVICILALLLIGQAMVYYRKHKDDGAGHDGEMGAALISMLGGLLGVFLLAAVGLAQLF